MMSSFSFQCSIFRESAAYANKADVFLIYIHYHFFMTAWATRFSFFPWLWKRRTEMANYKILQQLQFTIPLKHHQQIASNYVLWCVLLQCNCNLEQYLNMFQAEQARQQKIIFPGKNLSIMQVGRYVSSRVYAEYSPRVDLLNSPAPEATISLCALGLWVSFLLPQAGGSQA